MRIPFAAWVALLVSSHGFGQDPTYTLRWHGQSFFSLETPKGKKIVFDPHAIPEFGRVKTTADLILCTHRHNDHAQFEIIENHAAARVLHGLKEAGKNRPSDWNKLDEKIGQIRVRTVGTYHDTTNGMQRGKNAAFVVEAEGLTVCHLGDLGHELDEGQVKAIGPVDILLVPVGGIYTINGEKARKVTEAIKPRLYAVPMHYGVPGYEDLLPADEFLDGQKTVKKYPNTNELKIPAGLKPDETYTVAVLNWKADDAPAKKP
jgi:L-ascorbate metabolism protein UlaG (beta-lactamase superfamily)